MAARKKSLSAAVQDGLQQCFDAEKAGVGLYTALSFRVYGPNMHGLINWLRAQAQESLLHAWAIGDIMASRGTTPAFRTTETVQRAPKSANSILRVALVHEEAAVEAYRALGEVAEGVCTPVAEFARDMVRQESQHVMEIERMLRPME